MTDDRRVDRVESVQVAIRREQLFAVSQSFLSYENIRMRVTPQHPLPIPFNPISPRAAPGLALTH
jgi:hypothetical protein